MFSRKNRTLDDMTWFQHAVPRPGEAAPEEGRDPGHGEASQAVAPASQAQPLPHQGGETAAGCRIKNDSSSGNKYYLSKQMEYEF